MLYIRVNTNLNIGVKKNMKKALLTISIITILVSGIYSLGFTFKVTDTFIINTHNIEYCKLNNRVRLLSGKTCVIENAVGAFWDCKNKPAKDVIVEVSQNVFGNTLYKAIR